MLQPSRRRTALLLALLALSCTFSFATESQSKQAARLQFEKAEQMREALNGRPEADRSRRDYQHVITAYRKVYYGAPASSKADASIVAVAELLAAMGRQFQPHDKDLRAAISEYEFLRCEYPGSKYRVEALFTIGQIYKEDLGDTAGTICLDAGIQIEEPPAGTMREGGADGGFTGSHEAGEDEPREATLPSLDWANCSTLIS